MKRVVFFILFLSNTKCFAITYYVKAAGESSSTGLSDAAAWSSDKIYNVTLNPGDSVLFKRGDVFNFVLYVQNSGTAEKPIYYGSYGAGTNPRISGFKKLTNWIQESGNIYYCSLDIDGRNLGVTVSGIIQNVGRYPKTGYLKYTGYGNRYLTVNPSDLPVNISGGEVVIKKNRSVIDRHKIVNLTGTSLNYEQDFNFLYGYNLQDPDAGYGYFIQNHISCLVSDKDWYYDIPQKRIYMYLVNNPSTYNINATVDFRNIEFDSKSYLTFENIDVEGSAIAGIEVTNSSNILITNCNAYNHAGTGVAFGNCSNVKYFKSVIIKTGDNGLSGYNNINYVFDDIQVKNVATVEGTAKAGNGIGNGISIFQGNGLITNCKAINSGFNGISVVADYIDIEKCFVDTSCIIKDDGGGIYVYNPNRNGDDLKIIKNNITLNSLGTTAGAKVGSENYGAACGIYLDNFSTNITVDNNFCANGGWAGILNNGGKNNIFTNNTCYNFGIGQFIHNKVGIGSTDVSNNTVKGNTFIAKEVSQFCIFFYTDGVENPTSYGTYDNNVYAKPIDSHQLISENGNKNINLENWKTYSRQDTNSKQSPFSISDNSRFRLDYNYSANPATVSLNCFYKDVLGLDYNPVIHPYAGRVTINTAEIVKIIFNK